MAPYPRLIAVFALLAAVYLTAIACDGAGGDETETGPLVSDQLPSTAQGGTVPQDTTIVFQGKEYQVVAATNLQQDDPADFEQIGTVEEASIPIEGEVPVYRRDNDPDAIYTGPLTPGEGGGDSNIRYRWIPKDLIAESEDEGGGENEGEYDPAER